MRVLFIVPYVPNLIRVRPYNLIRHLAARGHEVTVLTLWSTERERAEAEALKQHCHRVVALPLPRWRPLWNCLRALPTSTPLQAMYCWQPALARRLDFEIRNSKFEIAHVEHLRGARYGLAASNLRPVTCDLRPAIVWDSVDCISLLFEQALQMGPSLGSRLKAWLDLERTRRYEGWLVTQFDRVLVTSPVDGKALAQLYQVTWGHGDTETRRHGDTETARLSPALPFSLSPHHPISPSSPLPITVLPNGVDLDYFKPRDVPRDSATLVLTGKMSYHANVAAALYLVHKVMPLIWAQRPDAKLCIVGKDPPREIIELKAQSSKLQSEIRNPKSEIVVTGTVPDVRPYLAQATVAVCPVLYSAGIQNKVLEAMAMGLPVVATPQSCAALKVTNGENILIAEESEDFARQVLKLSDDEGLRERMGRNGRRYVEEHHDWRDVAQRLEEIYQDVMERRKWTA